MLDRALQKEILTKLAERYPGGAGREELGYAKDDRAWTFNAWYLHQHQLLEALRPKGIDESMPVLRATITAKGLDFLQDDGGLSAILNVVTVRFDADTLRALLASRIDASGLPDAEKSKLRKWLEEAGADALKDGALRVVNAALDKVPDAIEALAKLLQ